MVAYSMFSPSVTAMRAQSLGFQSISDNIANVSTTGYKAGRISFQELVFARNDGGAFNTLSGTQAVQQVFREREGTVVGTDRRLDAALSGEGFFVTSTSFTPADESIELTDAGRFGETLVTNNGDEEVYLSDIKGNFLLGWNYDPTSAEFQVDTNSTASLQPIRVDETGNFFDANATTTAALRVNLPATAAVGETYSYDLPIFDGTGSEDTVNDAQQLIATFVKNTDINIWDLTLTGTDGTVATPAVQPIQVTFDANGDLSTVAGAAATPINISVDWTNSGATTDFTFDLNGSTQYANVAEQVDLRTDGNSDGVLTDVFFADDGVVQGVFSNGFARPLAKIAVGDVISPDRLLAAGETHWRIGPNSGALRLVDPDGSARVFFAPQALEGSTTNLENEFSNMIITQRAYSSAATALRTVDEMVRTASELKS